VSQLLEAWEEKYGPITNDEIEMNYIRKIALRLSEKNSNEQIKLGKKIYVQEVLVCYCDL